MRPKLALQCLDIDNKGDEPETVMGDVKSFEISLDRKKLLIHKADDFYVFDSDVKSSGLTDAKALGKAKLDLAHWTLHTTPREEFHGFFLDAWRLERDYFYDRHMQGVDWVAMRERYLPLVDRVSDRDELNDVIAQMVSELSALHTFVRGGDQRMPEDSDRRRHPGRAPAPRSKRPAAMSWSTSTCTIPTCPTPRRRWPGLTPGSPKAKPSSASTASTRSASATSASCCAARPASRSCSASSLQRAISATFS